ncbi:MAG TPA: hypothetical protein VN715_22590 [Roseiarcus sp.]|nr:hypothetical protein [Roseiarcus sp.]
MTKLVKEDSLHYVEEEDIVPPPVGEENGRPKIVTADMARQGPLGRPVLWVLVAALALACIGLLAVWVFTAGAPPPH